MTRASLPLAVLLALSASSLSPSSAAAADKPAPILTLDIDLSGAERLSGSRIALMQREVERVWRPCGVILRWRSSSLTPSTPGALQVIIEWTPLDATSPRAPLSLGSLLFVDGRATNIVRVSATAAERVVSLGHLGDQRLEDLPKAVRRDALARVLGRTIAHEIGHYLLGPGHTDRGVMRASFATDEVVSAQAASYAVGVEPTALAKLRLKLSR